MKALLIGGRWLGGQVAQNLVAHGFDVHIFGVAENDVLARYAAESGLQYGFKPEGAPLIWHDLKRMPDLVVSAHSFRFVPQWLISEAAYSIGYHPSLLPAHKGRHSVEAALASGSTWTGGTVFHLSDEIDGGRVAIAGGKKLQRRVRVIYGETPRQIWQRALAPVGVELFDQAFRALTLGELR